MQFHFKQQNLSTMLSEDIVYVYFGKHDFIPIFPIPVQPYITVLCLLSFHIFVLSSTLRTLALSVMHLQQFENYIICTTIIQKPRERKKKKTLQKMFRVCLYFCSLPCSGDNIKMQVLVCTLPSSHPHVWHRASETLVSSQMVRALGTSFVLMRQLSGLLDCSWIVTGYHKDQAMIRSFEFSVPLPIFQRGEIG